jgi:hypothetical protein
MDCTVARELLDLSARRTGDDADLAVALEHVRACPACAEQVRSHQRFDDAVAIAMRDVTIPEGLKDRLLASVAASTASVAPPASAPSKRRTRWAVRVAACAAAIAISVGVWQLVAWQLRPRPFDLDQVFAAMNKKRFIDPKTGQIDLSQSSKFDESFNVKSLAKWLERVDLRGIDIDGRDGDDAAMTLVQLGRDRHSVAVLLMIPAARLKNAPELASQASVSYSPHAHAVMRDGGYVYVYVTTANNLEDLKRLARGLAA